MKLKVEPIPRCNWQRSLSRILPKRIWDNLRRAVYAKDSHICAICGNTGRMNCHEVWRYNDTKHTQTLVRLECICSLCHDTKHWGNTVHMVHHGFLPKNYLMKLTRHWCLVNGLQSEDFELHKLTTYDKSYPRNFEKYTIVWGKYKPSVLRYLGKEAIRKIINNA